MLPLCYISPPLLLLFFFPYLMADANNQSMAPTVRIRCSDRDSSASRNTCFFTSVLIQIKRKNPKKKRKKKNLRKKTIKKINSLSCQEESCVGCFSKKTSLLRRTPASSCSLSLWHFHLVTSLYGRLNGLFWLDSGRKLAAVYTRRFKIFNKYTNRSRRLVIFCFTFTSFFVFFLSTFSIIFFTFSQPSDLALLARRFFSFFLHCLVV